ncbi:enoyl-CoA hydratase-related protein [Iamia majanohamensis]|uniref:Enoyl-CoA hydratase-related protein n=1 Tax=Iamia majanohamensis TaxID=467976 RepID=A0AAE9YDN8_9ACTN|nr:enoyl-CoA hydratase-related protein [Iamia majanohamensis]WCO66902.1 enoyl-CoA hydratase-related protein [Iamia majanohamensis]
MTSLDRDGEVWILDLGDGDNRFDPTTVDEVGAALDQVAASEAPAALVTTASGKIWSNGLDLDHLSAAGEGWVDYVQSVQALFARLLRLPVPTVAAIQGHAFAAGAMCALAHDVRVMRADRGYICLPEVDLGMPFSDGMVALISGSLAPAALHRMAVLGERIPGPEAVALGVADAAVPLDQVRDEAVGRATALAGKAGPTLATLRRTFHGRAIDLLDPPG